MDRLVRAGRPVVVDAGLGPAVGWPRVRGGAPVAAQWLVTEDTATTLAAEALPGARVVASSHPLDAADEARLRALVAQLAPRLEALGRADQVPLLTSPFGGYVVDRIPGVAPAERARLVRLDAAVVRGVCWCAVVSVPPGTGPGPPPAP